MLRTGARPRARRRARRRAPGHRQRAGKHAGPSQLGQSELHLLVLPLHELQLLTATSLTYRSACFHSAASCASKRLRCWSSHVHYQNQTPDSKTFGGKTPRQHGDLDEVQGLQLMPRCVGPSLGPKRAFGSFNQVQPVSSCCCCCCSTLKNCLQSWHRLAEIASRNHAQAPTLLSSLKNKQN